jgi:DNA replication and repair protein RecF
VTRTVLLELRLDDFRCFGSARLPDLQAFTVLAGGNGAGKTSLLEALYLLGRGSSFRAARAESTVHFDRPVATLFGRLDGEPSGRVGVEISRETGLNGRIDGRPATRSELARTLPVQLLDPASHELIAGAPAARRQFLDWSVFHVEQSFYPAWQRYRRALQQRNAALRERSGTAWAWDASLVEHGLEVDAARQRLVATLEPLAIRIGQRLLDTDLTIEYSPGWPREVGLEDSLRTGRDRDLAMGTSQVGPHRADLRVTVGARRARGTVSRGQEKLLAAALTLAQVELVAASLERPVVLLVDEPAADLDAVHLAGLIDVLRAAPVQVFLTTLDSRALPLPAEARVFHVEPAGVRAGV